jgi:hypothetical protein
MPKSGTARLELVDVNGEPLAERVDIAMIQLSNSRRTLVRDVDASKPIVIHGLEAPPNGLYRAIVDPPSYLRSGTFVHTASGAAETETIKCVVDPLKAVPEFPAFTALAKDVRQVLIDSKRVLGLEGKSGAKLYAELADLPRAGLLNILGKCGKTGLSDGTNVLSKFVEILELRMDRFFAVVPHAFREEAKNSEAAELLTRVPEALHKLRPGFSHAGSWKTPEAHGNLQLSFSTDGTDWLVDVDIDEAGGIQHFFEVIRNSTSDKLTHPYLIHQILVGYQRIDPLYSLTV